MERKGGGRMKCPKCDGTGDARYSNGIFAWVSNCDQCGGSGIIEPLTEQEYLQSCNTEQLADVFFDYRYINATPQQQLWLSANNVIQNQKIAPGFKKKLDCRR